MSSHNIGFYADLTKISFNYHQISSNTHLISSSVFSSMVDVLSQMSPSGQPRNLQRPSSAQLANSNRKRGTLF